MLSPDHLSRYITGSGISEEVASVRGYRSLLAPADWEGLNVRSAPTALYVPSHDVWGGNGYYQVRYDVPITVEGVERKYGTPKGAGVVIDVHPSLQRTIRDSSVDLWIVEGVRKADAGITAGYCCVGMPGANMGYTAEDPMEPVLRKDFEAMALNNRRVYVCLDSDSFTNPAIYKTFRTFCTLLSRQGAHVYTPRLQPRADGSKTGLDDFLVAGGRMESLAATARPFRYRYGWHDTGNGERFVDRFAAEVCFVPSVGFYIWTKDTGCWEYQQDRAKHKPSGRLVEMAKAVAKHMTRELDDLTDEKERNGLPKFQTRTLNEPALDKMISMAETEPMIGARLEHFDSDPELINCANGVLNLRTLTLAKHSPLHKFTHCVPVRYDAESRSTVLDGFLRDLFPDDRTRAAVFRALGTALVGDNRLNKFFIIHGPGGAGKGTLLDIVTAALNGYARSTSAETWIRSEKVNKFLQLDALRNARFVHSEELPKGSHFDEAFLKNCTGGDLVQARPHFKLPYEYRPKWTLFINTNERPRMNYQDSGMHRRYFEIPMPHAIPEGQRDMDLRQRLVNDPDVLTAMFRLLAAGASDFLTNGLQPTEEMARAIRDAWLEQEPLREFVQECITVGEDLFVTGAALKVAYQNYCKDARRRPITAQEFNKGFAKLTGATQGKRRGPRGWIGATLTGEEPEIDNIGQDGQKSSDFPIFPREENTAHVFKENPCISVQPVQNVSVEVIANPVEYHYVDTQDAADWLTFPPGPLAVDIETTGLNPRQDRVRLVTVSDGQNLPCIYDLNHVRLPPNLFADRELIGHNLAFEFGFLPPSRSTRAWDTMLATQVLDAGLFTAKGHYGLASVTERFAGVSLNKDMQLSDWSSDLTADQLRYAASDVLHLHDIKRRQIGELSAASLMPTAELEMRALFGVQWMSSTGIGLNFSEWMSLTKERAEEQEVVLHELNEYATINWNSPKQVSDYLDGIGVRVSSTAESTLSGLDIPVARLLCRYRELAKATGTYGENWSAYIDGGRIHAGWKQCFTATGRMSCNEPNLQNLPRDPRVRACFQAGDGKLLVSADFSQIEARIASVVSGDTKLQDAFRSGDDVYAVVARQITGNPAITKGDPERQMAKSATLGLMFGMGNERFVEYCRANGITPEMADEADLQMVRAKFFKTYSRLREWQREQGADDNTETFSMHGRRRLDQKYFSERLNHPIQATAADGMKAALARLWEESGDHPGIAPVLCIHDSLTVECDEDKTEEASDWVARVMVEEMVKIVGETVPIRVDVSPARKEWQ